MFLVRVLVAVALSITAQAASADGKIYASDYTPEIPDQRALIAFDGERQVMLIESRVALPDGRPTTSLGWVVPVPAVPEIAVAGANEVRYNYQVLRRQTDPETMPVAPIVFWVALAGVVIGLLLRKSERPDVKQLRSAAWIGLIGSVLAAVSLSAPIPASSDSRVDIVKALRVGPLDAKVVRAPTGAELVNWLKSNGFVYGERDVAVIEDYLRRKWLFVVAKLAPEAGSAFEGASTSPPLVLSFPTKDAVYPLALTAVGGKPLDLVLYVFAPFRVQASVSLKVDYAGGSYDKIRGLRGPDGNRAAVALFDALKGGGYLTKLSGKLSPEDMRTDMRLVKSDVVGDVRHKTTGLLFNFWFGGALVTGLLAFLLQLAGHGRWQCNGFAWCLIAICISPFMLLFLLGSVGQQWWDLRKAAKADE